jgi:hypothetical protein
MFCFRLRAWLHEEEEEEGRRANTVNEVDAEPDRATTGMDRMRRTEVGSRECEPIKK